MTRGETQVIVVGSGQAGLAAGFYLRRRGLDFVICPSSARYTCTALAEAQRA